MDRKKIEMNCKTREEVARELGIALPANAELSDRDLELVAAGKGATIAQQQAGGGGGARVNVRIGGRGRRR